MTSGPTRCDVITKFPTLFHACATYILLAVRLSLVAALDPLCLDAQPLFTVAPGSTFPALSCTDYAAFGCCAAADDRRIAAAFSNYTLSGNTTISNCSATLKVHLCLECSPYAAQLYDAETQAIRKPVPGLCPAYCAGVYGACARVLGWISASARALVLASAWRRFPAPAPRSAFPRGP